MAAWDLLVFDFDGVLVDSVDVKTQAFAALYREYGPAVVDRVVAWHLAHGGVSRYEKFRHFHREFLGRPLGEEEASQLADRFSDLVEEAVIAAPWLPGAREFLEGHGGRFPLGVASGTPEEELLRIMDRRGMRAYFSRVGGAPRQKGEIISSFLAAFSADPSRTLMIGDAGTDLEGARQAGVRFLGIAPLDANPFPAGVPVLPDLSGLAGLLAGEALLVPSTR